MKQLIMKVLDKWTSVRIYDYDQMLGLSKGYTISRIHVKSGSWCANKNLMQLELDLEGLVVLAIQREVEGLVKFIGAPKGETRVLPGDVLICYSKEEVSKDLSQRLKGRSGDKGHHEKIHLSTAPGVVRSNLIHTTVRISTKWSIKTDGLNSYILSVASRCSV